MKSASRRRSKQSSDRNWFSSFDRATFIKALLIGGLSLTVATLAGREALVGATRVRNPDAALMLDASDPRASAQIATRLVAEPRSRDKAVALAKSALSEQALVPMAFAVLATAAIETNDIESAKRYLAISRKISRRDELTNIQSVEISGREADIGKILENYDIALRTNSDLAGQLMPRLVSAMELPQFAPHYIKLAKSRPPWLEDFTGLAVETTKDPAQIARLLIASGGLASTSRSKNIESLMLQRLDEKREWQLARAYYLSLRGSRPQILTSTEFSDRNADPSSMPISWTLVTNAAIEAGLYKLRGDNRQGLSAIAQRREQGIAASKLLFLQPGKYQLSSETQYFRGGTNARATLSLSCVDKIAKTELGEIRLAKGRQALNVALSPSCTAQRLEILMVGGDQPGGAELALASITLRKM